jgi:hypothetical protein
MGDKNYNGLLADGIPLMLSVYDNWNTHERTSDRYCVVFTGMYPARVGGEVLVLTMGMTPLTPGGECSLIAVERRPDAPEGMRGGPRIGELSPVGVRIRFMDLPLECQHAVIANYIHVWGIPYAMVARVLPPGRNVWKIA